MRSRALVPLCLVAVLLVAALPAPVSGLGGSLPELARRLATLTDASRSADVRLAEAAGRRDAIARDLVDARDRQTRADSVLADLDVAARRAVAELGTAKARVAGVVRAAYVGRSRDADVIVGLLSAPSAAEFARRRELTNRVGAHQEQQVKVFRRARDRAASAVHDANEARDRIEQDARRLEGQLPEAERAATQAEHLAGRARFDLDRWSSVKDGPGTPIMGVSRLTATDLTRWYLAQRYTARITVPITDLARAYVEEGDAAGVRGDLAFAQSLVETGSFSFPDYGQVHPPDNNFAGIGACDSCPSGRQYTDARTGVRAQIQLLRAYADRGVSAQNLGHPPVDPALPNFLLRGAAVTWSGLTGKWATSTTYGDSIFAVFLRILSWVTDHPAPSGTG